MTVWLTYCLFLKILNPVLLFLALTARVFMIYPLLFVGHRFQWGEKAVTTLQEEGDRLLIERLLK